MLGACERCDRMSTLYVVPGGELREPYYCETCAKAVASERYPADDHECLPGCKECDAHPREGLK